MDAFHQTCSQKIFTGTGVPTGVSRIFQMGAPTKEVGALIYYLVQFLPETA